MKRSRWYEDRSRNEPGGRRRFFYTLEVVGAPPASGQSQGARRRGRGLKAAVSRFSINCCSNRNRSIWYDLLGPIGDEMLVRNGDKYA